MSEQLHLGWDAPGPISQRFMDDRSDAAFLNGPIGSGKTTTCIHKSIKLASEQRPATRARARNASGQLVPVRMFKLCCVVATYRQMWRALMPSWFRRIPKDAGDFGGAENAPCSHRVAFQLADGTIVDFYTDFVAIGENAVEDTLRGYEPTMFYLFESDLLSEEVFTYAAGRTGRYPPLDEGGSTWHGIIGDLNAPELHNWTFKRLFDRKPEDLKAEGVSLYRLPDGLSPQAENLHNLQGGAEYYRRQARLNATKPWYIARMIRNKPGFSREGKPVYLDEFNDALHVRSRLDFVPGIALQVGLDAGLNPAAIFGQRMPNGQWRILGELVGATGTGARRFAQALAKTLKEKFQEARTIKAWADPSAAYGADKQAGEQSWIEIVAAEAGITVEAAPTNKLIPRLEAVRLPLTRLIDTEPGLLLSDACLVLRQGFNATYRYRKVKPNEEVYAEEPEKNEASHPHDALQYLLSGGGEHFEVLDRKDRRARGRDQRAHQHEWDPFSMEPMG